MLHTYLVLLHLHHFFLYRHNIEAKESRSKLTSYHSTSKPPKEKNNIMSSPDPSGFVRNPPSVIVKVQNTSQELLNGQLGVVVQFSADRGRYLVHMASTQQTVALKPENLVKGNMLDQAKAQYLILTKDPRVRQEISKYYQLAISKLPPGVKPEYAVGGLGLLMLLSIYFFGFTRMIMLISIVLMLGLIVGPDVFVNGSIQFNWRLIVANFPSRCRAVIEQSAPMLQGKLSNKMAAGIVLFLLVLSARSIFLPAARPPAPPASSAGSFPAAASSAASIEQAYKFGFDDATLGKEFGTSLPKPTTAPPATAASMYDDDLQPINLPRNGFIEAPKPWYSKLGMWQIMSIMNIGRTIFQLGMDPMTGTFSPQMAMVNLQQADPMKLGLLGFSVYNVLKVFF